MGSSWLGRNKEAHNRNTLRTIMNTFLGFLLAACISLVVIVQVEAGFGPFFIPGYELGHVSRRQGSGYGHRYGHGYGHSYGHQGYGGHRGYGYGHSHGFLNGLRGGYGGSYGHGHGYNRGFGHGFFG